MAQNRLWLRVEEYACATQLSQTLVRRLLREGAIPHRRFGRIIRIHASALSAESTELGHVQLETFADNPRPDAP